MHDMKRYEPIPREESKALVYRLAGKSLEEIIAMLGPPTQELGPSPHYGLSPDQKIGEAGYYTKTLEYVDVTPTVKRLLVHVCEDGQLVFEFRGARVE